MPRFADIVNLNVLDDSDRLDKQDGIGVSPLEPSVVDEPARPFTALGAAGVNEFGIHRPLVDETGYWIQDRQMTDLEFTRYQESGSISPYD